MKRIISFILIFCMIAPLFSFQSVLAQEDIKSEILFYDTFDDVKTNDKSIVGTWAVNGNSRVIEKEAGKNKVMLFSSIHTDKVSYNFGTIQNKFVAEFELELLTNNAGTEISVTTQSNSVIKLLAFETGGAAQTWDGYQTGISAIGRKVHFAIAVNTKLKTYSVYKDGKCILENWRCSNLSQSIKSFSISLISSGESYEAELDNVKVYTGSETLDSSVFPPVTYEPAEVEFTEEVITDEAVGDKIFVDESFENIADGEISLSGIGLNNKGNPIRIEYDRSENTDYLVFEGFSSDPHIDVTLADTTRYMVFQADFKSGFFTGGGAFWLVRDASGIGINLMSMSAGTISLPDKTKVVKLEKDVWHNIAAAVDFSKKVYDVYLDRQLIKEDVPFTNTQLASPTLLRIHISSCGSGGSQYCVDNYRIYEAQSPSWEASDEADAGTTVNNSVFESDDDIKASLAGSVALMTNSPIIWAQSEKKILDSVPVLEGDTTYVPVRAVSEAFGIEVGWNDATSEVTIDGSTVKVGSTKAVINGKETELPAAPMLKNDRCMLPLRTVCEDILGKNVYWNDGLIVIGNSDYSVDDANLARTKNFVKFYRPDAEQIMADFAANGKDVHPRILMTQTNVDNMKKLIAEGNENALEYYNTIINEAEAVILKEPVEFNLPDGYRLLTVCQEALKRVMCLGIAYLTTDDEKYAERAWLELKAVCEFNTWNYRHHLDVGEMTTVCAIGYDWFYDYWTGNQRKFIADAIYEKSLSTYYAKFMKKSTPVTFQSWTNGTNWNAVCNGGTIVGALAAVDYYPEVCYDLISKCLLSTEKLWNEFGPQGSWPEGPGYLIYALEYICFMISTMDASLGTNYGLINMGEIGGIGNFFAQTDGYTGANNYQDMSPGHQYVAYLFWMANVRGEPGLGQIQTKMTNQLKNPVDPMRAVSCLQWYDSAYDDTTSISFPLDDKFSSAEVFCTRSSWSGDDGIYLSAHGGYNNHNHWHIDSGTFVLDAMGERWAVDYGADNYNAEEGYWGTNRYKFYRLRPEGHNCIVINPEDAAGQDMNAFAPITRFESSEKSSIAVIDLTDTYGKYAESYRRGYMLGDSRRTVTIRDEVKLKEPGEIYWFMQTGADVEIESPTRAILTIGFKRMIMEISSDTPYEFYVGETVPLETSPTAKGQNLPGKKRITIKYTGVQSAGVSVKFTPYDFDGAVKKVNSAPIDSWTLEDGEYRELPRLSMIYIDGEPLYDFTPINTHYRLAAPESLSDIPGVTAEAPDGTAFEVEQTTDITKPTRIRVYEIANPDNAQYYNLGYFMLPKLAPVDGKERYQALSLVASSEPEPDNTKENAFNGIIGDRWAANGKEEWLLIDLGEEKDIGKIGTAFIQGDVRVAKYGYKISTDKENWETVFDGSASGTTLDLEYIDVNKKARYIMFEGHGNNVNTWNSISEIAILAP